MDFVQKVLFVGDSTSTGIPETQNGLQDFREKDEAKCKGLLAHLHDGDNSWWHCTRAGDAEKHIQVLSRANKVGTIISTILSYKNYVQKIEVLQLCGI